MDYISICTSDKVQQEERTECICVNTYARTKIKWGAAKERREHVHGENKMAGPSVIQTQARSSTCGHTHTLI